MNKRAAELMGSVDWEQSETMDSQGIDDLRARHSARKGQHSVLKASLLVEREG